MIQAFVVLWLAANFGPAATSPPKRATAPADTLNSSVYTMYTTWSLGSGVCHVAMTARVHDALQAAGPARARAPRPTQRHASGGGLRVDAPVDARRPAAS